MNCRERIIAVNGLDVHVLEWGNPAGAPLVLVHGFLDLAWSWLPLVEHLGEEYRIVAPDCRGHGDSGWVRGGYYYFPDYVGDLAGLAETLRLEKFFLLGHSMGGNVAALYAGTFPARVGRLIIIESLDYDETPAAEMPARMEAWINSRRRRLQKPARAFASLAEAAARLQETEPDLAAEFARFLAEKGTRPLPDGRRGWKFDPLHLTSSPHPYTLMQAQAFWRRVACPVLLISAGNSSLGLNYDRPAYDAFREKSRVVIPGAGHMVHREKPGEVARIVAEFLTRPGG